MARMARPPLGHHAGMLPSRGCRSMRASEGVECEAELGGVVWPPCGPPTPRSSTESYRMCTFLPFWIALRVRPSCLGACRPSGRPDPLATRPSDSLLRNAVPGEAPVTSSTARRLSMQSFSLYGADTVTSLFFRGGTAAECSQRNPRVLPGCSQRNPRAFPQEPECSQGAPTGTPECSQGAPRGTPECSQGAPTGTPGRSHRNPRMLPGCSQRNPKAFP